MSMLKIILPKIHNEGYYFITSFAVVSLIMGNFFTAFGWIGTILTAWCIYFFRNPDRITPIGDHLVISPADGVVQKIEQHPLPPELDMGDELYTRISIFLNVFNVHVNRVPASGTIRVLNYHPGKFLNASLDKASLDNERQTVLMASRDGKKIAFVQIAGLIARRIICDLEENQEVKAGQRFGIIRFGSRMDVYLPQGVNPLVVEGQQAVGGETILASLQGENAAAIGEIR